MTDPTGNWTFSLYVGKRFNHSTRCFRAGLAQAQNGGGAEPGAVGAGVWCAAQFHLAD